MKWEEALEIVVSRTHQGRERYLLLCDSSNSKHQINRDFLIKKAESILLFENNNTLPPLVKQLINLGKSTFDYAKSGFSNVSMEEYNRRLSICESCELFRPSDRRCSHSSCGCFMDVKAWQSSANCPMNFWSV